MLLNKNEFDNPPLEFEQLKECMWVWYEPLKEWKKINRINPYREYYQKLNQINPYPKYFQWIEFNDGYAVEFKEKDFYRKQKEIEDVKRRKV